MGKKKRHKIEVTSFAPEITDGAGAGKTLHVKIDGKPHTYETWFTRNSGGSDLYDEDGNPVFGTEVSYDRLDELSQIAEDAYWATMMNLGYAGMVVQAEMDAVQAAKHPKKWAAKIARKVAPSPAGASAGFLAC